jgi:hypothetical protein
MGACKEGGNQASPPPGFSENISKIGKQKKYTKY